MSRRDAYVEKIKAQIDEWNADIDKLGARVSKMDADARLKQQDALDELRNRRDQATAKLREIQGASGEAWEDVRSGLELSWESLKEGFKEARSRFD